MCVLMKEAATVSASSIWAAKHAESFSCVLWLFLQRHLAIGKRTGTCRELPDRVVSACVTGKIWLNMLSEHKNGNCYSLPLAIVSGFYILNHFPLRTASLQIRRTHVLCRDR